MPIIYTVWLFHFINKDQLPTQALNDWGGSGPAPLTWLVCSNTVLMHVSVHLAEPGAAALPMLIR